MTPSYTIYVIDDDELVCQYIEFSMGDIYQVKVFSNAEKALKEIKKTPPHLILLDNRLPGMSGLDALKLIKSKYPEVIVIMITGLRDVDIAVSAMKIGAYDYVLKPIQKESLANTIHNALETFKLRKDIFNLHEKYLKEQVPKYIGKDDDLLDIMDIINKAAKETYSPVLIMGEKGSGKELIAQAIHARSANYREPMLSFNCGSIPFELIESELFGNQKEGIDDIPNKKIGFIESAREGSLFLNEIHHLPKNIQWSLYSFIKSGNISNNGDSNTTPIRVRIFAATNKNLLKLVEEGSFLKELYDQISVFKIEVPNLNQRPNDVISLANYFLNDYKQKYHKTINGFSLEAENGLKRHYWKGNVRELRNVIERGVIVAETHMITLKDLFPENEKEYQATYMLPPLTELVVKMTDMMELIERYYIKQALELTKGNESRAAKLLGMTRDRLRYRRAKHKI